MMKGKEVETYVTYKDTKAVVAAYESEESFLKAVNMYIQTIRNTGGEGLDRKEIPLVISTLKHASIHVNGSWKGDFGSYIDGAEEIDPAHREKNRIQIEAIEALGIMHASGLLE